MPVPLEVSIPLVGQPNISTQSTLVSSMPQQASAIAHEKPSPALEEITNSNKTASKSAKQAPVSAHQPTPSKERTVSVARIAIGGAVMEASCTLKYEWKENARPTITLDYLTGTLDENFSDEKSNKIELDSVSVLKYHLAPPNLVSFISETDSISFLYVKAAVDELGDEEQDVVIEFRSDEDFDELLKDMRQDEALSELLSPELMLTDENKEEYGGKLFEYVLAAIEHRTTLSPKKERKSRARTKENIYKVYFPHSGDDDLIEEAAVNYDIFNSNYNASAASVASLSDNESASSSIRSFELTKRDLRSLDDGRFLNDVVINFFLKWYVNWSNFVGVLPTACFSPR